MFFFYKVNTKGYIISDNNRCWEHAWGSSSEVNVECENSAGDGDGTLVVECGLFSSGGVQG